MKNEEEKMMWFAVYMHQFATKDGDLIRKKFIVLKSAKHQLRFTDFHRYCYSPKKLKRIQDDGNNRFDFAVQMLNYLYFVRDIGCLENAGIEDISAFLNDYGMGRLPWDEDGKGRTKSTVQTCLTVVLEFWEQYIDDKETVCRFRREDLYKKITYRDKYGKTKKRKVPVFDVFYMEKKKEIFRDIPNSCFDILFQHISDCHPDLMMLVALSAFAGLRPAEACNVRRVDSPYGPGLDITKYGGEVRSVTIDLSRELVLRSDLKPTGGIKKERHQKVPDVFLDAFLNAYNRHMEYLEGREYEAQYGPLSINGKGLAITYDNYYTVFRKIVSSELIPIYLRNEDPEVVRFGLLLQENNLSPHVFRHWYTVQLVLSGINSPRDLAYWRGDSNEQSAFTYLQNKGELEKQYRMVTSETFDYLQWAARKKHQHEEDDEWS